MSKKIKKIVCLGGGNAMPKAVLAGLKKFPEVNLSVICAMLDTGGSAGREREIYKTNISFGDIRRVFLELSEVSSDVKEAFRVRFKEGPYKGIVIANILGTAVVKQTKDYETTFRVYREILRVPEKYEIFPATLDNANLCAVLENGKKISGEKNIDKPKHKKNLKIRKTFLQPKAKIYSKAKKAIGRADLIVIGPGDLYSTLSQILLVQGMARAIQKSKAKKVYICNLMTKSGETNNFSVLDFTKEIEKYLGIELDYVIYNTKIPSEQRLKKYRKEEPALMDLVRFGSEGKNLSYSKKFIGENLLSSSMEIIHDPNKLAKIILKLCRW